jgi:hypothetical protein
MRALIDNGRDSTVSVLIQRRKQGNLGADVSKALAYEL